MARATNPDADAMFSAELRAALNRARLLARQVGATATNPDHLACGMLAPAAEGAPDASAAILLNFLDFDVPALYRALRADLAVRTAVSRGTIPIYDENALALLVDAGALALAESDEDGSVLTAHLLLALVKSAQTNPLDHNILVDRLSRAEVSLVELHEAWATIETARAKGQTANRRDEIAGGDPEFVIDLTAAARADLLDPIIGREAEIERTVRILCRRTKNNPVLLGPPGVGKTGIAEGLAQRIVSGDVPDRLIGKRILSFTAAAVVAGTKYRGDFEARVIPFLKSVRDDPNVILFIDELHTIVGAGTSGENESSDLSTIMKPMLSRGELRCMGATTHDEYRRYIEGDAALERRFAPVDIKEPSEAEVLAILVGLAPRYGSFHSVTYPEAVLEACITLAARHLPARRFPDKAIDIMDEAGAKTSLDGRAEVMIGDVLIAVAGMASTTVEALAADPVSGSLAARLSGAVLGQPLAITTVATIVESRRLALTDRHAPLAAILLVGPAGSGKSTLAQAIADAEFDGALTTLDMSKYGDRHTVSDLVGAPAGYIGYDEPGRLVEPIRRRPAQVLLLQHIDAAAPEIRNVVGEILRGGTLADSHGRVASFRDAVIVLTVTEATVQGIGFRQSLPDGRNDNAAESRMRTILGAELIDLFDAVVPFIALDDEALESIASLQLTQIQAALARRHQINLTVSPGVRKAIVARSGRTQGARPIKRTVERLVEHPLARAIGTPTRRAGRYHLDLDGDVIVVRVDPVEVAA